MAAWAPDDTAYFRAQTRSLVRGGYDAADEIEARLIDIAEDFEPALPENEVRRLARVAVIEEVAMLKAQQAAWPVLTDYDRLHLAFERLEDQGIIARENFTCCGTCGAAEIGDETEAFEAQGRRARGYVFFHMQDTESAVEYGSLYFNYGAFGTDSSAENTAIAHELVHMLDSVGLKPEWNGRQDTRVGLKLNWQRRWDAPVPQPIRGGASR